MKTITHENGLFPSVGCPLARAIIVAGSLFAHMAMAFVVPPGVGGTNSSPFPPVQMLDSWTFQNSNLVSDTGHAPLSSTNIFWSNLGFGSAPILNSTNPAWLQYNVYESDGTTNLTVDSGTAMLWIAPSWSSANAGGTGPGEYGRLWEAGGYSPDSSLGWWSIYLDDVGDNLYFSAQTNDLSGTVTTYFSYPISWTSDYWHHVAVTYSTNGTALYLDGVLVTNGPAMTVYPGPDVLANGFWMGSDSNGVYQAGGMIAGAATYNGPMSSWELGMNYNIQALTLLMNPRNKVYLGLTNAASTPTWTNGYEAITGAGSVQWVGTAPNCANSTDMTPVWFTNVMAKATNGVTSLTFTVQGGVPTNYDVFATVYLSAALTNDNWVWLGQVQPCNTYTVQIPTTSAFLILGTPQSSCGCGLTDAYLSLVAKESPDGPNFDSYGVPYAWYAQNGLVPITAGLATQDPDLDGLLNYQEYLYGTRPNVSEGFSVWVGSVNGTTVIP